MVQFVAMAKVLVLFIFLHMVLFLKPRAAKNSFAQIIEKSW